MATPGLRSRTNISSQDKHIPPIDDSPTPSKPTISASDPDDGPNRLTLLDILRVLGGLLLLSTTLSYFITGTSLTWNYRPAITRPARIKAWLRGPLHLTDAQLTHYNGTNPSLPILLALNGSIYDVSASPHLYGPGGSYHFFAGRDATRAFVTGCFESDLNGDLRGVERMFMPADGDGAVGGEGKREGKLRREREVRVARGKVREVVRGWERMFDGGKGGKYFWVGRVDRGVGSGWEGWGSVKELCEKAREGRPRSEAGDVGK